MHSCFHFLVVWILRFCFFPVEEYTRCAVGVCECVCMSSLVGNCAFLLHCVCVRVNLIKAGAPSLVLACIHVSVFHSMCVCVSISLRPVRPHLCLHAFMFQFFDSVDFVFLFLSSRRIHEMCRRSVRVRVYVKPGRKLCVLLHCVRVCVCPSH